MIAFVPIDFLAASCCQPPSLNPLISSSLSSLNSALYPYLPRSQDPVLLKLPSTDLTALSKTSEFVL